MEIEESRRVREERREVTDALREAADEDCDAILVDDNACVLQSREGLLLTSRRDAIHVSAEQRT
jgi:hypothetical protein